MKKLAFLLLLPFLMACGSSLGEGTDLTGTEKETVVSAALPTADNFYKLISKAEYDKTLTLINPKFFNGYSDQVWLDFTKGQDANYGKVTSYDLIDSEASAYTENSKGTTLIFEVQREKRTIYERLNFLQFEGKGDYKIVGAFFSENKEGIYNTGN